MSDFVCCVYTCSTIYGTILLVVCGSGIAVAAFVEIPGQFLFFEGENVGVGSQPHYEHLEPHDLKTGRKC